MREWLSLLLLNLEDQRRAMVADDLPTIMELIDKQHAILGAIEEHTQDALPLSSSEEQVLRKIIDLVAGNQLLAQQSLRFARRVLSVLNQENTYGAILGPLQSLSGQALDKRV